MDNSFDIKYLWNDKKRILGMPISFTKYALSEDRIFTETGVLGSKLEEILLYRIKDITLTRSLWQKMFGVGTVTVYSDDKTNSVCALKNIAEPIMVKELIHQYVEKSKTDRNMKYTEFVEDRH